MARFTVRIIDLEDHGSAARAFGRDVDVEAQIFSVDEHWVVFYANAMDNSTGVAAFPTPRVIGILPEDGGTGHSPLTGT
jgi:hypothetical protein